MTTGNMKFTNQILQSKLLSSRYSNPRPQHKIVHIPGFNLPSPVFSKHTDRSVTRRHENKSHRQPSEERNSRDVAVHWSFRASGWPKSSKLIGFQSCPFTSNWKTFLVIRQINHTSLCIPYPSTFLIFFSSISDLLPFSSISSFTVFFRLSATDQGGKEREGKGEGRKYSRRNLQDRSNRLSHASADQGWPSLLLPLPLATFL